MTLRSTRFHYSAAFNECIKPAADRIKIGFAWAGTPQGTAFWDSLANLLSEMDRGVRESTTRAVEDAVLDYAEFILQERGKEHEALVKPSKGPTMKDKTLPITGDEDWVVYTSKTFLVKAKDKESAVKAVNAYAYRADYTNKYASAYPASESTCVEGKVDLRPRQPKSTPKAGVVTRGNIPENATAFRLLTANGHKLLVSHYPKGTLEDTTEHYSVHNETIGSYYKCSPEGLDKHLEEIQR